MSKPPIKMKIILLILILTTGETMAHVKGHINVPARDVKENENRDKELAWIRKYWHVGKWELSVEDLKLILDLKQNGKCNVYLINRWVNDLSYEKTTNKIYISPINDVNLEFNIDNNKRKIYSSDYTPLIKL